MAHNQEKLTVVMLNGKNYHLWARQVKFSLSAREKLGHVNGEALQPNPKATGPPTEEEKKAISKWRVNDHQVISWLLATMDPKVADLLSYKDTAMEIWERADKLYGHRKNFSQIYQIQRDIRQAKQNTQFVMELFGYLQKKKDELKVYRQPTIDLAKIRKREEQDDIFQFLSNLDSSYEAVKSQILLMTELPSMDEVAGMVEREETRRVVMGPQTTENSETRVFVAVTRQNPNPRVEARGDQTTRCEFCRKEGHSKDECWCLHPHLRPKGQRRGGDRKQGEKGGFCDERRRGYVAETKGIGEQVESNPPK